jgi:hypothetical protein
MMVAQPSGCVESLLLTSHNVPSAIQTRHTPAVPQPPATRVVGVRERRDAEVVKITRHAARGLFHQGERGCLHHRCAQQRTVDPRLRRRHVTTAKVETAIGFLPQHDFVKLKLRKSMPPTSLNECSLT